ncbi:biotin-dependent carboxyltransferase family protein [Bacillus piscicola]|uniref:5-oxoprolinase subunit C family protein n=1 Tax=Bacillus piscicola TaxID=1632684 RepID=UPI001F09B728|nr:biotin-dependent carboxyltransferase family protein [Bacillus piscicola]
MIVVKEAGLWTTVQDTGRSGGYHLGVPPSGAADQYSYYIGNLLVANPAHFAALEMTLMGGTFLFHKNTVIALTGAPMKAYLNHELVPFWEALEVKEGDVLTIKECRKGVKSYLCVSGGIQVEDVFGSKSTYEVSKIGGFKGRKLQSGDELSISEPLPGAFKQVGKSAPLEYTPTFNEFQELRVIMGLSSYLVSDEGLKNFLTTEWKVSYESNRVAYRYTGGNVSFTGQHPPFGAGESLSNVVDFAFPIGSIMFTNEKELIILHNDATTGGGYVTVGTVISQDLDLMAQLRPASTSRFITVTFEQAMEVRAERRKQLEIMEEMLLRS